jgi:hypothetical protein
MKGLVLLVLVCAIGAQQIQPIPVYQDGIAYGPGTTNYTLDVFYDHVCVDSAGAFPGLYEYWQSNQSWLRMVIHIFPLPYHYYSFTVGRAGRYIQLNYPDQFLNFTSMIFSKYTKYTETAQTWTQAQLYYFLATDASAATNIPYNNILNSLNDNSYGYNLRISWKYAASKGITGTPQYMVNGILTPNASNFETAQDWTDFFNSLS